MKLNQSPTLRVEDYPTEMSWIGRLFITLNPFIQGVNQVLNSNVDFTDNIKSVSRNYVMMSFQEFSIKWPHNDVTPNDVRIIKASTGTGQLPTFLFASWKYDATTKLITITQILEATTAGIRELTGTYQFTLRATV